MMKLELTHEELKLLLEELKYRLGTIREEVYHSETYSFTVELKRKKSVLKELIGKVEVALQAVKENGTNG